MGRARNEARFLICPKDTSHGTDEQGRTVIAAERTFPKNVVCFLTGHCWPPDLVETFELDQTGEVTKRATLSAEQAEALFSHFVGLTQVEPQKKGLSLVRYGGRP